MGYYNVVAPCVVGLVHYASVPDQPIPVDDDLAAPLVESGDLAPYVPGHQVRWSPSPEVLDALDKGLGAGAGAAAKVGFQLATKTIDKKSPRGRRRAGD